MARFLKKLFEPFVLYRELSAKNAQEIARLTERCETLRAQIAEVEARRTDLESTVSEQKQQLVRQGMQITSEVNQQYEQIVGTLMEWPVRADVSR